MMIPFALAMPLLLLAAKGTSFGAGVELQARGDGTVPTASAHPDAEKLSTAFDAAIQVQTKVTHKDLAADASVLGDVMKDLQAHVLDFLAT
jgi:hypothetical protein